MGEITWGTAAATIAAPFVFLLPGWALLSLLLPVDSFAEQHRPDVGVWLSLAAGMTLAVTPLALLFLDLIGLRAGTGLVLVMLVASALIVTWRQLPRWRAAWSEQRAAGQETRAPRLASPLLVLTLALILVLGVRLWVVRGINVGFWGDSYQHTMIAQLLVDHGGLFRSWQPYAELQTLTYHFGFHADVALFHWATEWLAGNPLPRTLVLAGQFLNVLAVVALYPLAVRLSGSRWTGVLAVFMAGLLTPMPMYYINWGRYTQLTGQAILPVAIWLTMEAVESPRRDWRRVALAAMSVAGLALAHYFVLAFYVLFLVPYLAGRLLARSATWPVRRGALGRVAAIGVAAVILVTPWAARLVDGFLVKILTNWVKGVPSAEATAAEVKFFPLVDFVPISLVVLAILGGAWALRRRRATGLLIPWVACLFLVANPHRLGLPGAGVINNFTVEMALYIPVAILAADLAVSLFGETTRRLPRRRTATTVACAGFLLIAAGFGLDQREDVIATDYQLVTPADEAALAWVRDNTPEDARFVINAFFSYGDTVVVGSDAGWWLPLLARRQTTVPPLTYGSEAGPTGDYRLRVNEVMARLQAADLGAAETAAYLHSLGISHVFVGEKGGPLLDVPVLRASPYYHVLYRPADEAAPGPWVFEAVAP